MKKDFIGVFKEKEAFEKKKLFFSKKENFEEKECFEKKKEPATKYGGCESIGLLAGV